MFTIFTKPNCVNCERTKRLFDSKNIEYKVVDLTKHPEDLAYIKENGFTTAPVIEDRFGNLHDHRQAASLVKEQ